MSIQAFTLWEEKGGRIVSRHWGWDERRDRDLGLVLPKPTPKEEPKMAEPRKALRSERNLNANPEDDVAAAPKAKMLKGGFAGQLVAVIEPSCYAPRLDWFVRLVDDWSTYTHASEADLQRLPDVKEEAKVESVLKAGTVMADASGKPIGILSKTYTPAAQPERDPELIAAITKGPQAQLDLALSRKARAEQPKPATTCWKCKKESPVFYCGWVQMDAVGKNNNYRADLCADCRVLIGREHQNLHVVSIPPQDETKRIVPAPSPDGWIDRPAGEKSDFAARDERSPMWKDIMASAAGNKVPATVGPASASECPPHAMEFMASVAAEAAKPAKPDERTAEILGDFVAKPVVSKPEDAMGDVGSRARLYSGTVTTAATMDRCYGGTRYADAMATCTDQAKTPTSEEIKETAAKAVETAEQLRVDNLVHWARSLAGDGAALYHLQLMAIAGDVAARKALEILHKPEPYVGPRGGVGIKHLDGHVEYGAGGAATITGGKGGATMPEPKTAEQGDAQEEQTAILLRFIRSQYTNPKDRTSFIAHHERAAARGDPLAKKELALIKDAIASGDVKAAERAFEAAEMLKAGGFTHRETNRSWLPVALLVLAWLGGLAGLVAFLLG